MKKRFTLYSLFVFIVMACIPRVVLAQAVNQDSIRQARQHKIDSMRQAIKHRTDSIRQARKHYLDSLRTTRKHRLDSIKSVRKARSDSLKAIRAYRNSKRYKDSVQAIREHTRDSIKAFRQHRRDSIKQARQYYIDSITTLRRHRIDSMKQARQYYIDSLRAYYDSLRVVRAKQAEKVRQARKRRQDSLGAIRAYRQSKRYKDSIAAIRKHYRDSIVAVRRQKMDSIRSAQKAQRDSIMAVRKQYNDSLRMAMDSMRAARRHRLDSIIAVRKARVDSLKALHAARKAKTEKKKKEREKKKKLALELKIKQKHENYSNKKMLRKKWSLYRRIFQNTYTRYNYYYNAKVKMKEAMANMLRIRDDSYDSLINLFLFDPNVDSARLASDMDSIIVTASTGIQIHDPRSKWQDDLYLLIGKAYYYKADYKNAGASFKQIVSIGEKIKKRKQKHKKKKKRDENNYKQQAYSIPRKTGIGGWFQHMPAANKAMLWLSRTLVQKGKLRRAQTLLDMLRNDVNFPKKMKGRLALEQAFIDLKNKNDNSAIAQLKKVSRDKNIKDWQRERAAFLVGQLYQSNQKPDSSNRFYRYAIQLHPPLDMDFHARKSIAFNELRANHSRGQSLPLLKKMAKDGKYKPFYDQIYYGLALANQKEGHQEKAIKNFRKSISFGKNHPQQMGLSYTALGDVYYKKHDYIKAKNAYDSAAILLKKFSDLAEFKRSNLRSVALSKITQPAKTVIALDSLLHLASLPKKAQMKIIKDYIKKLRKARRDSLLLAKNGGGQPVNNLLSGPPTAGHWYFSNPNRVNKGKMAFKQTWGDRELKDNWQLSSQQSFGSGNKGQVAQNGGQTYSGIPDEETLYAAIPHGKKEIYHMKDSLMEALFILGKGYYKYLRDYPNAQKTLDTLSNKFPDNPHQAEVLYLKYLMAIKNNHKQAAQQYQQKVLQNFPNSKWAKLFQKVHQKTNKEYKKDSKSMDNYYDSTYNILMSRQYQVALQRTNNYDTLYKNTEKYDKKFQIVRAIALIGLGEHKKADSILMVFIKAHPKDKLTDQAKDLKNYIKRLYGQNKNQTKGKAPPLQKTNKEVPKFTYNKTENYYIIVAAPADMRIFALKSGMRDFNMTNPGSENVSISLTTLNPETNMILIQTFKNLVTAKAYFKNISKQQKLYRDYKKNEYHLLLISQHNYHIMTEQRSLKKYLIFYGQHFR